MLTFLTADPTSRRRALRALGGTVTFFTAPVASASEGALDAWVWTINLVVTIVFVSEILIDGEVTHPISPQL